MSDLEMIKSPEEWPYWPFLPLKRPSIDGNWPECQTLIAEKPLRLLEIGLWNLLEHKGSMKDIIKTTPSRIYQSAEELIVEGWIVD